MQAANTLEENLFFNALSAGDANRVRDMVSANPSLLLSYNQKSFGATPLTQICFGGRQELLDLLIDLGADPNRRSDWHMGPWSPLHCAIYRRDHDLARHLLGRGATMDLHTAVGLGDYDQAVKLIDENPSSVHERGGDGCFPLHFANTVQVAELLLERGADIDGRCIDHYSTPVQYLCTSRPQVASYLLSRGAQADIFSAVLSNDLAVAQALLVANPSLVEARINQMFFPPSPEHDVYNVLTFTVGQETTPLHAAANENRAETIPFLLQHGAKIDARGGYDEATPLHLAAWKDCLEAATALVDQRADINLKSGKLHNNSPAGWAIVSGAVRVFEMLLERGAEVFPWFIDDAKDGCNGRFDQFQRASSEARSRILHLLSERPV